MSHSADASLGPLIALMSATHDPLIPMAVKAALLNFTGNHAFEVSPFSPPFDTYSRNVTSWHTYGLSVGAESLYENQIGGPSNNPEQFNPAVIQWLTGSPSPVGGTGVKEVGWTSLHATEGDIDAVAGPGYLNLTYPHGNSTSIITLLVSMFGRRVDLNGWQDIDRLNVKVSGNVNMTYDLSFSGSYGMIK